MGLLSFKEAAIAVGAYGPLRLVRRALWPPKRNEFHHGLMFYRQFIRSGDLCFDVGANVGGKTELFLALGAKVVAFEPQPACVRELKARCSSGNLTVLNVAIGDSKGELPLYVGKDQGTSSLISGWYKDVQKIINVPVITFRDAIDMYGVPQFCKIDVEGYEWEVLKKLDRPIQALSLEYHHNERDIRKILTCVDHLSRFSRMKFNITVGEQLKFMWPRWISHGEFRDYFPSRVPKDDTFAFGDLFICVAHE
jgi:FkbM family methyltransferase